MTVSPAEPHGAPKIIFAALDAATAPPVAVVATKSSGPPSFTCFELRQARVFGSDEIGAALEPPHAATNRRNGAAIAAWPSRYP